MGRTSDADGRYRVLVVDDDEQVLESTAIVLSADVDVVTATSAERALRLLARERFDVVCTDFKMSGMTGADLLDRVAELPYPIGCLVITGNDDYFRSDTGRQHYVLLKPYEPERLIRLVLQLGRIARMKHAVGSRSEPSSTVPPPPSSSNPSRAPSSPPQSTRRSKPDWAPARDGASDRPWRPPPQTPGAAVSSDRDRPPRK